MDLLAVDLQKLIFRLFLDLIQFVEILGTRIKFSMILMTKKFDKTKFELIDQVIENEGDLRSSQIPKALTTVISDRVAEDVEK